MSVSQDFLREFQSGRICLHPTDTILGLTANPNNANAMKDLHSVKKRSPNKSFVFLASSLEQALSVWAPLESATLRFLESVWPAPLTFVHALKGDAPKELFDCAQNGSIALRVPSLPDSASWMKEVLLELDHPIPSTSANISGEQNATSAEDVRRIFADDSRLYIPAINLSCDVHAKPSTIVRIDCGELVILREGAISKNKLMEIWNYAQNKK